MTGVVALFDDPRTLADAVRRLRADGFARLEVYGPEPVEGVEDPSRRRGAVIPLVVFAAGVLGAAGGFLMQYYGMAVAYPLNIGGRPLNSWPAFATTTFELAVLAMVLTAVIALFRRCRLPRLYDPVFDAPGMERATQDRYVLRVEVRDGTADRERLDALLRPFGAAPVGEVPS